MRYLLIDQNLLKISFWRRNRHLPQEDNFKLIDNKFFVVPSHSFYFTFYGARGESFSEGCKCPSENALAHFSLILHSFFVTLLHAFITLLPYFVTSSLHFVTFHDFITSRHVEVEKRKK